MLLFSFGEIPIIEFYDLSKFRSPHARIANPIITIITNHPMDQTYEIIKLAVRISCANAFIWFNSYTEI